MVAFDHMRLGLSQFEGAYRFLDVFEAALEEEKHY